jgi:regulator of sirC expression with transglutaminase-like and TPR domain
MKIFLLILTLLVSVACAQNEPIENNSEKIDVLEAELRSKDRMDTALGSALTLEYSKFVDAHPKDSRSAVYLFKKAQVLKATNGKHNEAIQAFQAVYKTYPYHPKGAEAMLATALFYEEMRSQDLAAATYKKFIATYPSNPLAENARDLLDLLTNTEETELEMVKKWKVEAENSEK